MKGPQRIALARVLFLTFAFWPFAHLALGLSGHISPWKFGGFGMYAVPSERVALDWRSCEGEPLSLPKSVQAAQRRFLARLQAFPRSSSPHVLSQQLLREFPEYSCVEAELLRERLSPKSRRWERRRFIFQFGDR